MRLSSRLSIEAHVAPSSRRAAMAWRRDGVLALDGVTDAEALWVLSGDMDDLRCLLKWVATLRTNRRCRHDVTFREGYRSLYGLVARMARHVDEAARYRVLLSRAVDVGEMRAFRFSDPSFDELSRQAALTWERMRVRALLPLAGQAKKSRSTGSHGAKGSAARADRQVHAEIKSVLASRARALQERGELRRWEDIAWDEAWQDKTANANAVTFDTLVRWAKGAFEAARSSQDTTAS